ncbi:DUF1217 domain-containing protein [Primorskyibacter aestuariivivens]|uniref:DUF1217 domain-containing protein n=1 Tax=Primorskyibacter aestuariivivens TaxID=1888912 RepID=UPI0022FFF91B|nr:DUF1217 domain-containing protein [Primorskyibacter aestuariivivens]MDA7430205.1 DUF1217 domain-containing protein [Primorskyibacter aestuariivivens]
MSFQPIVPGTGLVAWSLLNRTLETQLKAYSDSPVQQRDTEYFLDRIGTVTTAEQLVDDRRLLRVALGAYGLQDDLDNRFFIKEILSQGTASPDALANKLADERYARFSKAFGFGDVFGPNTKSAAFAREVVDLFNRSSFEVSVGDQDETMRLALNATRELERMATADGTNDTKWFLIMGTPPLRQVFETALNLPSGFGKLDLDRQLETFKDKALQRLGSDDINSFADAEQRNELVQHFLLQSQLNNESQLSGGSIALQLLQTVS